MAELQFRVSPEARLNGERHGAGLSTLIPGDKMAEQTSEFDGRPRGELAPGVFGMTAVLVAATIVAILYFAREVFVPITLAVLLSFLLAPAVRLLRRLRVGRVTAVAFVVVIAFMAIAGFAAVFFRSVEDSFADII